MQSQDMTAGLHGVEAYACLYSHGDSSSGGRGARFLEPSVSCGPIASAGTSSPHNIATSSSARASSTAQPGMPLKYLQAGRRPNAYR